jgi:hypothetical protein
MKKHISNLFVICFIGFNLYSFDFHPLDVIIDFNDEMSIQNVRHRVNYVDQGDSYYFLSSNKIMYNNIEIPFRIYVLIDNKQIPFESDSLKLLKAYYSGDDKYDESTLFYNHKSYFEEYDYYNSFVEKYKARDVQFIDGYESDVIFSQDGTRIERDFSLGRWPETGYEDKLTYYIMDSKGLYAEYIIEVYNSWKSLSDYETFLTPLGEPKLKDYTKNKALERIKELYTLTNYELNNYQDQDDPRIQFMKLMNEAMTTFRFKERSNIPDNNLGTVTSDRVRVRSFYDLDSDILGHVNTGEEVIVMERSPGKEVIGDMNDYWFRVLSKSSYIKGWIYGAFLELEE